MAWDDLTDGVLGAAMSEFGRAVTYTPSGGVGVEITAVFDSAHVAVDPDSGVPVHMNQPVLGLRLRDLPVAPAQGDGVTVNGTEYVVVDLQVDGQGGARLRLQLA